MENKKLLNKLPDDIIRAIINNDTSLGNNPAIPDIFEKPYLLKIVQERFEKIKDELLEIGSILDIKGDSIEAAISEMINKCKELERPYRSELEKLCLNYLIDFFNVPEETIVLNFEITDDIDLDKETIILEPIDSNLELLDIKDALDLKNEVYKRRLLDTLCMGAAIYFSSNLDIFENDINNINPKLMDLYKKILLLNDYLLFTKENIGMNDKNKMQLGTVEVSLATEDKKVNISSQGVIFPILLSESIRGFLELFISHGLPEDKNKALNIINKADFLKAEPWDMRIGPALWNILYKSFNNIDSNSLPYLIKKIACLNIKNFNYIMKEIFAKTKHGKEIMGYLSNEAKKEADYDKFVDKMTKNNNKSVIADEFIHQDEL